MRKPFREIYELIVSRYNIEPSTAVYIDDNARNLTAPADMGIHTIHFQSPQQLRNEFDSLGLFQ